MIDILVDLQALQTTNSRHRGIGRYTLALFRAMASAGRDVRFSVLFNSAFVDEAEEARSWIADLVPDERIHAFDVPGPTAGLVAANEWRSYAAESLLRLKVRTLAPDFFHVCSLFEALTDDSVTTIANDGRGWAATLYDLIPWYHRDVYLENKDVRRWYMRKLDRARHAELLFAISGSARREAIETLGLDGDRVIDIQGDVDPLFDASPVPAARRDALLGRLRIARPFALYTAGIDFRKNIEGLIAAYADLPQPVRLRHQLVIVCSITPDQERQLTSAARGHGLQPDELVCTGFVPDADLADLYRLCRLFVFPSLHEGFGMPVLEAMRCGAPVIGSDCSSVPEILGIPDAAFDPRDRASMASTLHRALRDDGFRDLLRRNSAQQQSRFSWDESARRVLDAFEAAHDRRVSGAPHATLARPAGRRRTLAFVSPLPPEQSGIANYSSELIPALSVHYDITLVTALDGVDHPWLDGLYPLIGIDEFQAQSHRFDRILYQIGNSAEFHTGALALLDDHPGVVVLHDFYLSNLFNYLDVHGIQRGALRTQLFASHGYVPLLQWRDLVRAGDPAAQDNVVWNFPASRLVFERSYGNIVHSEYGLREAGTQYGVKGAAAIARIEHIRAVPRRLDRNAARTALSIEHDAVVVCSFGLVSSTKLNEELIAAWCNSALVALPNHHLLFLGPLGAPDYEGRLRRSIAAHGAEDRIHLKGFVDDEDFERYLDAADCAVQLRTRSRGETSGAVLHCLAHGLPVVVNRHGTLAEIPTDCVRQVNDRFDDAELAAAILAVLGDAPAREAQVERGLAFIGERCAAPRVGADYRDAIERLYAASPNRALDRCMAELLGAPSRRREPGDLERTATIATRMLRPGRTLTCLLDLGGTPSHMPQRADFVEALIGSLHPEVRVEPVSFDGGMYRFARTRTSAILSIEPRVDDDEPVDFYAGDHLVLFAEDDAPGEQRRETIVRMRLAGVRVHVVIGASELGGLHGRGWCAVGDDVVALDAGQDEVASSLSVSPFRTVPVRRVPLPGGLRHDAPCADIVAALVGVLHRSAAEGADGPSTPVGAASLRPPARTLREAPVIAASAS